MKNKEAATTRWHFPRPPMPRCGFTLVELLVVISIIALLISILLPSLKNAREQAKVVKCLAALRGAGQGNQLYGSEFDGWFVGSPVTTGQSVFDIPGDEGTFETRGAAVQVWDWAGPIAAMTGDLNQHRAQRWRAELVEDQFRCPSNNLVVGPYPGSASDPTGKYDGWGPMTMVSYYTMRATMTRGGQCPTTKQNDDRWRLQYFHPQIGGYESPPERYVPRMSRVGTPAEKIFLADSARYIDVGDGKVTYNYQTAASAGGAFSANAPTAPDQWNRSFIRSSEDHKLAKYTYRHKRGSELGIGVVYFDCHAAWMSEKKSRWPDPWWPKDTLLPRAEMNWDTEIVTEGYRDDRDIYHVRR